MLSPGEQQLQREVGWLGRELVVFQQAGEWVDLVLRCQDGEVGAHRALLAGLGGSKLLAACLHHGDTIVIPVPVSSVQLFIQVCRRRIGSEI